MDLFALKIWWIFAIIMTMNIVIINGDDCLFTDTEGFWCRCDGPQATCTVATVKYDFCGHNTKSSTQVLIDKCVQSKLDPLHVAYQNRCTQDGDVEKRWYTTLDCHGEPSSILQLSTNIAPCAQIHCSMAKHIKPTIIISFIIIFSIWINL